MQLSSALQSIIQGAIYMLAQKQYLGCSILYKWSVVKMSESDNARSARQILSPWAPPLPIDSKNVTLLHSVSVTWGVSSSALPRLIFPSEVILGEVEQRADKAV